MQNNSRAPEPGFGLIKANRWLFAALAVALIYSLRALHLAFRVPYLVQDDARQHIFWMRRYLDPALFPNDLIANYFQTVAPIGYKAFYWIFAKFCVDPCCSPNCSLRRSVWFALISPFAFSLNCFPIRGALSSPVS